MFTVTKKYQKEQLLERSLSQTWSHKEEWQTLMAMLLDSVAPLVKMISLGSAPIRSATCCSEETTAISQNPPTLQTDKKKPRERNQPGAPVKHVTSLYLSRGLHCRLTLPAIRMCSGVRVAIVINLVGQHGVQHAGILLMSAQMKQSTQIKTKQWSVCPHWQFHCWKLRLV